MGFAAEGKPQCQKPQVFLFLDQLQKPQERNLGLKINHFILSDQLSLDKVLKISFVILLDIDAASSNTHAAVGWAQPACLHWWAGAEQVDAAHRHPLSC